MNCEYCESQKFSIIKFQDKSYPKIKFTGDQNIEAFSENIVDQTNDIICFIIYTIVRMCHKIFNISTINTIDFL